MNKNGWNRLKTLDNTNHYSIRKTSLFIYSIASGTKTAGTTPYWAKQPEPLKSHFCLWAKEISKQWWETFKCFKPSPIPTAVPTSLRKPKRRRRRRSVVGARGRWPQSRHWLSSLSANGCSWISLLRCLLLLRPLLWMTLGSRRALEKVGRSWCSNCIRTPNAVMGSCRLRSWLRELMEMG